jgi:mannose-6-phosphate isomerase-like protein (cupin superfamily)
MTGFIRRVVTGHDASGKAVVISDGLTPRLTTNPLRPGHRSTEIWKTSATPVTIAASEADPTLEPRTIQPPKNGTVIRIAELEPETEALLNVTGDAAREIFKASGNENASTWGRGGRHPMMHRTETVDYVIILEGELVMLLDDQDVLLKQGDVVIQRGTHHAWSNRSGKKVRLMYVLLDGHYDADLAATIDQRSARA